MSLCSTCGRNLIPAPEFMGHHWRHEADGYRHCLPPNDTVWGTPDDPEEGEAA